MALVDHNVLRSTHVLGIWYLITCHDERLRRWPHYYYEYIASPSGSRYQLQHFNNSDAVDLNKLVLAVIADIALCMSFTLTDGATYPAIYFTGIFQHIQTIRYGSNRFFAFSVIIPLNDLYLLECFLYKAPDSAIKAGI